MLSPAMSYQDQLGAMITHYKPRIQSGLISAILKSNQEALAFLTKLQPLENSRQQYKPARRDVENQDKNNRPNASVQVHHVGRDGREENPRSDIMGNTRTKQCRREFSAVRRKLMMALTHN